MKYGEFTEKVAEAKVPRGWPFGPGVCAVSPHWTIVLSAPAPSMVMHDFNWGMVTFSLEISHFWAVKKFDHLGENAKQK